MRGVSSNHEKKLSALVEKLGQRHGMVVAFSGGVDSSLVAALAHRALGHQALAVTIDSPLIPSGELDDAKRTAGEIGIEHAILRLDELAIPGFATNPIDRCYLCKRFRFETLKEKALEINFEAVADGTTSADLRGYRPGLKAAKELGIYSPLLEEGLSKEDTRILSSLLGLPTADKPPSSCLATRIPYGHSLEPTKLKRIDRAEAFIRALTGAKIVRVRDHGNLARIEIGVLEKELLSDAGILPQISQGLKGLGYEYVTMDLDGYSPGSYDRPLLDKME